MKEEAKRHLERPKGFSLVEVLVTVGIVSILATLGLSAYNRSLDRARETQCISNLRQIGVGLAGYTGENNNRLPGPLLPSQGPRYNKVNGEVAAYLASYIAGYVGIPEAASGPLPSLAEARRNAGIFYCPAFGPEAKNGMVNSYFMRWKIAAMGTSMPPWGNYGTSTPQVPKSVLAIPDRANTWAISDLDQKCPDLPAESWVANTPVKPVHGKTRNALFFDWHVAKISETGEPQ